MRQMRVNSAVKRAVTKAQLDQALIAEAYRRSPARVAGLLAQGADPNARDKAGVPALFYAEATKGNALILTLLLNRGANVNARDPHGNTPLAEAVQLGAGPLAALLLHHKADPNVRNGAGFTPLGIAAAKSDTSMVRLLLTHGAGLMQAHYTDFPGAWGGLVSMRQGSASHWTSDASPVFIGTGSTMRASSTASAIAGGAASAGNPVFLESEVFF